MTTVGACQRALDMVLEYVRGREQFGVPIGSFQAVKHKAVDMYVAIERARALGYFAALTIAEDDDRRSLAASMAKAAAGDAQRIVVPARHPAVRRHRVHLGERPAPLPAAGQGRRAAARRQPPSTGRGSAARLLDAAGDDRGGLTVQLTFDDADRGVPPRVRRRGSTPTRPTEADDRRAPRLDRRPPRVGPARGSARCSTPAGSCPATRPSTAAATPRLIEQFVHQEELARRGIYASFNPQGLGIVAPSILDFGTDEQKRALGRADPARRDDRRPRHERAQRRLRPRRPAHPGRARRRPLRRQRPEGVDLGRPLRRRHPHLRPHRPRRAEAQGHQRAARPDRHARASPGGPFGSVIGPRRPRLQRGLLRRRPRARPRTCSASSTAAGGWPTARSATSGRCCGSTTPSGSTTSSTTFGAGGRRHRRSPTTRVVLDWYASVAIDAQALKLLGYRAARQDAGGAWRPTSSRSSSCSGPRRCSGRCGNAVEALGPGRARPHPPERTRTTTSQLDAHNASWFEHYLRSFAGTIAGGTSEIQRNIIAERVLGLPR